MIHPNTTLRPSHATAKQNTLAVRDGQNPNQPARAEGLLRSSGFQIRDAVPARIHTNPTKTNG